MVSNNLDAFVARSKEGATFEVTFLRMTEPFPFIGQFSIGIKVRERNDNDRSLLLTKSLAILMENGVGFRQVKDCGS